MANRPGRKSKYTPETLGKIEQALKLGATRRLACQYAGVDPSTFENYLRNNSDFSDMVNNAEGHGAIQWLAKIEKAANDGNWQAAAWKLERRYPKEYGRQVQEIVGKDDGPIDISVSRAKLAQLLAGRTIRSGTDADPEPTHGEGSV